MVEKVQSMNIIDMKKLLPEDENEILQQLNSSKSGFEKFLECRQHTEKEMDLAVQLIAKACSSKNHGRVQKLLRIVLQYEDSFLTRDILEAVTKIFYGDYSINLPRLIESYAVIIKHILKEFNTFSTFSDVLPNLQNMVNHLESSKVRVDSVKNILQSIEGMYASHQMHVQKFSDKPSDSFRTLSIFPQSKDIKSGAPNLRPNIIDDSYPDVESYLDTHFRLMREDMVSTFRVSIENYKHGAHFEKLKVYHNVSVSYPPKYTVDGICHEVSFECSTASDWGKSGLFLPGSIVCLSDDSFRASIGFATIVRCMSENIHGNCKLQVTIEEGDFDINAKQLYSMIDTTAYFESYRHVLIGLKRLNEGNFPLADYIVHLCYDDCVPEYLEKSTFCLHEKCDSNIANESVDLCKKFRVLNLKDWPSSDELKLDKYQHAAFQAAITQRLSLIQGPPGTGKTYLGVKIIKTLLENVQNLPIIICCLTNHALDQFLEHLTKHTKKIIRIGQQSQSSILEPYKLFNMRQAVNRVRLEGEFTLCRESSKLGPMDQILKESLDLARLMVPYIVNFQPTVILDQNYCNLRDSCRNLNGTLNSIEQCMNMFMENSALNMILNSNFKDALSGDNKKVDKLRSGIEHWLCIKGGNAYDICKRQWAQLPEGIPVYSDIEARCSKNIWGITVKERFHLFHYWRQNCLKDLKDSLKNEKRIYVEYINKWTKPLDFDSVTLLQKADIIGVTMTGASKHFDHINVCKPTIMLVEEAAQALESHLVSCLFPSIQQLILIGDHQQLRPIAATHILEKSYNLNISLFERLFRNNAPSSTLVTQHRMRPEIADLLVPTIYPVLESHSSVYNYENINGIPYNLFFFKHQNTEDKESLSVSVSNKFEAAFIAHLVSYFLKQGYVKSQITVLAMYAEQVRLIQKVANKLQISVFVTTVDNYQGEENDIIVISFVRSNEEGYIGFLKESNRVCVALSRARKGLYCIGNFTMFARVSKLFENIVGKLVLKDFISDKFPLQCIIHKRVIYISENCEFDDFLEKGCQGVCGYVLPCGHTCSRSCHFDDFEHKYYKCHKPCERIVIDPRDPLSTSRVCQRLCWKPCESKKKKKKLPCGHTVSINWNEEFSSSSLKCQCEVDKVLSCNHIVKVLCFEMNKSCVCNAAVRVTLNCGHVKYVSCSLKENLSEVQCDDSLPYTAPCGHTVDVPCQVPLNYNTIIKYCQKSCDTLLSCGHACVGLCRHCFDMKIHSVCSYKCDSLLPCGHTCQGTCGSPCLPCELQCSLHCSHMRCTNPCSKPCIECIQPCARVCNHQKCARQCYEICEVLPCKKPCTELLDCGHQCIGLCGDPCPYWCRVCTPDLLKSENPESDYYVLLEDCNHVIEIQKLTSFIMERVLACEWPCCPECNEIIRKSQRFSDQIKETKLVHLKNCDLQEEINEVEYLFHTMFGVDNIVPWRFQNAHRKIQYILTSDTPSEASLFILKVCIISLRDLFRIEKKAELDLNCESRLEALIMWICNHLREASYQQLSELGAAVSLLEKISILLS